MAIKSEGGLLAHPLYEALTALKTGQGDLAKVTHGVAVDVVGLPKGRHDLWNLYWDYENKAFTRKREFGKTIWLCWHYTAYMGGPCAKARRDRDITLLGELLTESITNKVKRNTRDLVAFHISMDWSKRPETYTMMGIIDGDVTPEWVLENPNEDVIATWSVQAGKELSRRLSGYKWEPLTDTGMSRHPIFEELIDRLERELDAKWISGDVENWRHDDLTNLVYKYGRGAVVDAIVDYGIKGIHSGSPKSPLEVSLAAIQRTLITAMLAPEHQAYGLYPSLTEFFEVAAHHMGHIEVGGAQLRRLISEYCYLNAAAINGPMDVLWVASRRYRDDPCYDILVLDQGEYTEGIYRVLEDPLNLKVLADRGAYDKLIEMATTAGLDTGERLQQVELQGDCYRNTIVVPKSAVTLI